MAEENCTCYFYWLGVALREADSALHAYALMTNHVRVIGVRLDFFRTKCNPERHVRRLPYSRVEGIIHTPPYTHKLYKTRTHPA